MSHKDCVEVSSSAPSKGGSRRLRAPGGLVWIGALLIAGLFSLAGSVSGKHQDIARVALGVEPNRLDRHEIATLLARLETESQAVGARVTRDAQAFEVFQALNAHFFAREGYAALTDLAAPENGSVATVLRNRRGTCVGLAIVYVALARRVGLDAYGVATPEHVFVRVRLPDGLRNVELLEGGREIDDATYRRTYKISPESVTAAVFMTRLTDEELVAHLICNQAVALGRQGDARAFQLYDRALRLHPRLVAAWYNRGIELMNARRLDDAVVSFGRAIELDPSDAQAHNNRGLAYQGLGRDVDARRDFESALRIDPALGEARKNLEAMVPGADQRR
jgi:regulator of sirC expression with transglutaminase-like and TPR domain